MYFSSHLMYHMYLCLDWFHLQKKTEFKARWIVVSCKAYRTSRGISLEKQYCKHPSQSLKLWVSCWLPSYSHESNSCQHVFWCQDYFKVDLQWLWLFTMFTIWSVWKHAYKKPRVVGYIFFETNSWGSRVHGVHLTVGYVAFFHILPLFDAWACKIGDPDWLSIWERRSMLRKLQPLHCRLFFPTGKRWNLLKSIESPVSLCSAEAIQQPKVALPMRIRWSGGSRFGSQDISGIFRWCQMSQLSSVHDVFCRCATPEVWPRRRIPGRHEATSRTWERRELEILNAPQKSAKPIETEADAAVGVPNMCGERCCLR